MTACRGPGAQSSVAACLVYSHMLQGCPITNYSILLGQERVEIAEQKIQKRLIERVGAYE